MDIVLATRNRKKVEEIRRIFLIEMLDATGQNDLKTQVVELDARIIENKVVYEGKDPNSIFGGNTVLHKITAKVQGRPPTAGEVTRAVAEALYGKTAREVATALWEQVEGSPQHVQGGAGGEGHVRHRNAVAPSL